MKNKEQRRIAGVAARRSNSQGRADIMEYTTLSPLAMFVNAGPVGKMVMLTLVLASVYTWVLIVLGVFSVLKIGKATRSARAGGDVGVLAPVDAAGRSAASWDLPGESIGEKRERIAEVMSRTAREFLAKEEGGLPNLAVISSVAPFIGLFGTVWGIMSSFAGIAQSQDTSLAVVAPGIAEALAATAYGLAAAIPASVGYNRIGAAFSRVGQNVSHYIEDAALAHVSGRPVTTQKREAA
jgi:biopolymer transport protein ExbB/TolQ